MDTSFEVVLKNNHKSANCACFIIILVYHINLISSITIHSAHIAHELQQQIAAVFLNFLVENSLLSFFSYYST